MPNEQDKKQQPNAQTDELGAEELDRVSGGAVYMKLGDIKGESRATVSKVDSLTIKQG